VWPLVPLLPVANFNEFVLEHVQEALLPFVDLWGEPRLRSFLSDLVALPPILLIGDIWRVLLFYRSIVRLMASTTVDANANTAMETVVYSRSEPAAFCA
jgi:hypothetical protein